jgi:hypothetical protein
MKRRQFLTTLSALVTYRWLPWKKIAPLPASPVDPFTAFLNQESKKYDNLIFGEIKPCDGWRGPFPLAGTWKFISEDLGEKKET